ncbi:MAG: 23S rRNA (adenine(1618)-N(6))-methyltransferase RlmF [Flavobacteriaceae bacterium]|nr:23S rRNA (adenine(1618)-N(6))-methyltransferase RlmF [Flavobacteriaceae bacterium]
MHKNNLHLAAYNFSKLCKKYPPLKEFVFTNKHDIETVNFASPRAVKALNTALLRAHYNIDYWSFSDKNLCPPIPGRSDYIHYLADLLDEFSITKNARILDIGIGATCIFPILGNALYNWNFVGTDIDDNSLYSSQKIITNNKLDDFISLRKQNDSANILKGIINENDIFSASICNPPFYASELDAEQANIRKLKGLGIFKNSRNFSGISNEIWYKGGEKAFLHNYLYQSTQFRNQCYWFTSFVSKKENIQGMYDSLNLMNATEIKTIDMHQGNKISRFVAWTFLTDEERIVWKSN